MNEKKEKLKLQIAIAKQKYTGKITLLPDEIAHRKHRGRTRYHFVDREASTSVWLD